MDVLAGNKLPNNQNSLNTFENHNYSPAQIQAIKVHCMNIAKTLAQENDKDLLEMAINSKDYLHRIGAAWYYMISKNKDDCLFVLMQDEHPLVSLAAREACCAIAKGKNKNKNIVDFGPVYNSDATAKTEAVSLWKTYFQKKEMAESKGGDSSDTSKKDKK